MRKYLFGTMALFASLSLAQAQNFTTSPCPAGHDSDGGWFEQARACEIRRTTLPLSGSHLGVTGQNGAIEVVGEDRSDVALEARVTAQAHSREEAESILHEIHISTESPDIRADGPRSGMGKSWSVSYKLRVPRHIAQTALNTTNGGVTIEDLEGNVQVNSTNGGVRATRVTGNMQATSTNGGLTLEEIGGSVRAETTNGGVRISLAGERWRGDGLYAKSTNGGINVKAPGQFAGHLVADTTNGGISVGFPVTVQGKIGRHLDTDVNGGGPPVRLETTNGGISIDRS